MKSKALFLWGPIISLAVLLGGVGLLRVYLAETAGVLVEELTGAGAEIESMDVAWFPPHVTIYGLKVDTGTERISAPRIDLFPNLSNVFAGEVTLDKAVLEQPVLQTVLQRGVSEDDSPTQFNTDILPKIISIRNAAFVVDDGGVESQPVTFSADVEKEGGFALSVKSMTIPEFGLTFSGLVDVQSTDPMKLTVDAQKGAFNPSTLLDFLHRFEYLSPDQLAMFTETKAVSADGFVMHFDAKTKDIEFTAKTFALDSSSFNDLVIKSSKDGWSLGCTTGQLDSAQMLALTRAHPDGSKALDKGIDGMGLKSLKTQGGLILKDVALQSSTKGRTSGSLSLTTPSFTVGLISKKDEAQTMTLNNFDGGVTFKNGKPTVSIISLEVASSAGGDATVAGEAAIPFSLAGTRFLAEARQFNWFKTLLNGTASKKDGRQINFDMVVKSPAFDITAKGLARNEFGGRNKWSAVLDNLVILTEQDDENETATLTAQEKIAQEAALDETFDFDFVREGTLSGKIAVRRLQYNDLPVMRDMAARIQSVRGRTIVRGRGRLCLMKVEIESVFAPDEMAIKTMVRGSGVQLPGVLGCFVNELPIYLRGRLTVQGNFLVHGKTPRQVKDSIAGDVVLRVKNLQVLKLSNLDQRLGFFLELLNSVDAGPDEGDSVTFGNALVAAKVQKGLIDLDTVRFTGKKVSVDGKGRLDTKEKRLKLDAYVTTPYGIGKDISIDSPMGEEKAS